MIPERLNLFHLILIISFRQLFPLNQLKLLFINNILINLLLGLILLFLLQLQLNLLQLVLFLLGLFGHLLDLLLLLFQLLDVS